MLCARFFAYLAMQSPDRDMLMHQAVQLYCMVVSTDVTIQTVSRDV